MTIAGVRRRSVTGDGVTSIALLLYEFATNAAKYGALSTAAGRVDIECARTRMGQFLLTWTERGAPAPVEQPDVSEGFGRLLERATVNGQLGGEIVREWNPDGLTIRLSLPLTSLPDGLTKTQPAPFDRTKSGRSRYIRSSEGSWAPPARAFSYRARASAAAASSPAADCACIKP